MHFTYEPTRRTDLSQGDLIARTSAVEATLREVHPHYSHNRSYRFFIVLTQRAELHYASLLAARVLQLTDSFQRKLGYLVGNLYSRVATEDWVPETCNPAEFERRKKEPIEKFVRLDKPVHRSVVPELKKSRTRHLRTSSAWLHR